MFNPKSSGFKEIEESAIKINNLNSPRTMFLQFGFILLGCTLFTQIIMIVAIRNMHAFTIWFENFNFGKLWILFLCLFLPSLSILFGLRYKPMFSIFHSDTGQVSFHSGKINFDIPFSPVRFAKRRNSTGKGVYIVSVIIYAVSDKPFHSGPVRRPGRRFKKMESLLEEGGVTPHYETVLAAYNTSTDADADESIEYLRFFMDKKAVKKADKTGPEGYSSAY